MCPYPTFDLAGADQLVRTLVAFIFWILSASGWQPTASESNSSSAQIWSMQWGLPAFVQLPLISYRATLFSKPVLFWALIFYECECLWNTQISQRLGGKCLTIPISAADFMINKKLNYLIFAQRIIFCIEKARRGLQMPFRLKFIRSWCEWVGGGDPKG